MPINLYAVYRISVYYLIIPILIFFLGWLRIGIGIILSLLLLLATNAFLKQIRNTGGNDKPFYLSKEYYIALFVLFIFLLSTGNTGFVGSWGTDIPWRNAIYQDLIHQKWPVIYDYSNSMLCYYMVFWLVPAEIASLLDLNEIGSNIVLFLWMYVGLILIFFLLCDVLKPNKEHVILLTLIFLFFSGINTFGMILKSFLLKPALLISNYPCADSWSFSELNINGVDYVYRLRTIFLCIADVYNQFFALAVSTLLFFRFRKKVNYYAFICLLSLPYSPIGFIGLFCVVALEFIVNLLNNRNKFRDYLRKSFSQINILCIFSIVPIFYLYFSMNFYAKNYNYSNGGNYLFLTAAQYNADSIALLILYYYLYFLIYALLIQNENKHESLYWIVLICLLIFPFFKVGSGIDFNLNASMSPYFILMILILRHLLSCLKTKHFAVKDLVLVFCLSVAMLTPLIQILTSFRAAYINNSISYKWTPWREELLMNSFKDKEIEGFRNFMAQDYDRQIFFKYFSKQVR